VILNKISRKEFRATNDGIDIIMDDEIYINLNGHDFKGNSHYFTSGHFPVDDKIKYKEKEKFPAKLLVWVAISKKGHSKMYFRDQKEGAVNGEVYKTNCITKRLIPFIKQTYPEQDILFWPDLASSHYSREVIEVLKKEKINFLSKERNPPNVPQLRPIESFWSHFKSRIFSGGFTPKDINDLKKRAQKIFKTFDKNYFEGLMKNVRKNVRYAAEHGVLSVIK